MEIKLTATRAHLIFEEIMTGDDGEDVNEVWDLMKEARFFAGAIMNGGTNDEGRFFPTESAEVRRVMEGVQKEIDTFESVARERYMNVGKDIAGSTADETFDAAFDTLIEEADKAEELIKAEMAEGIAALQASARIVVLVQVISIAVTLLRLSAAGCSCARALRCALMNWPQRLVHCRAENCPTGSRNGPAQMSWAICVMLLPGSASR
ncbi:hypothetical protein V6L77_18320 [Pannonibacter sp. Pt2-lr]